jgi:hypothetical protein
MNSINILLTLSILIVIFIFCFINKEHFVFINSNYNNKLIKVYSNYIKYIDNLQSIYKQLNNLQKKDKIVIPEDIIADMYIMEALKEEIIIKKNELENN